MNARFAQYTNDIVSLTVLVLMSIALIAGQANGESMPAQASAAQPMVVDKVFSPRSEGE